MVFKLVEAFIVWVHSVASVILFIMSLFTAFMSLIRTSMTLLMTFSVFIYELCNDDIDNFL